jgi:peptide methionine sulfoxide reductase msrA/msrB
MNSHRLVPGIADRLLGFTAALLLLTHGLRLAAAPPDSSAPAADAAKPATKAKIPSDEELRKKLTPEQYAVTRENATERPFTNQYWKTHDEGIYVDIISGKPLFSSKDKFDSECGWPAFAKPIDQSEIKALTDKTFGMERTEVRSKTGDAHLGHVFNDGPPERGGLRYCINSASIRFIPKAKMAEAGYAEYLKIFESQTTEKKKK